MKPTPIMEDAGRKVDELMSTGMSQSEIADVLRMTQRYVSGLRNREYPDMKVSVWERLCKLHAERCQQAA